MNRSTFLTVICPRCKKEQTVFGKASSRIKCSQCNYLLTRAKGGKAQVRAKVKKVIWT